MSKRWFPGWLGFLFVLVAPPAFAQEAPDPEALVARLADANERAAAREQLLVLGAAGVPAMAAALANANDEQLGALLAVLTELGPHAGAAVPAVVAMIEKAPSRDAQVAATLAELVPWRAADVDLDLATLQRALAQARNRHRQSRESTAADSAALQRLRARFALPRDLDLEALLAQASANQPLRVELAVEFLGQRGAAAAAAVPMLRRILDRPEPRVLGTDDHVPLHRKAATALLAIAPGGADADLARDVLAGRRAPPTVAAREVPARLQQRIAELVAELAVADKRSAAIDNLVALGEVAALPVAMTLSAAGDEAAIGAALAVLRGLGPHGAPAVPSLFDALTALTTAHTCDVFETLAAVAPWATDQVSGVYISASIRQVQVCRKSLTGEIDCEFLTRFSAANAAFHACLAVDAACTPREWEAHLAASVTTRECALRVLATQGAAARPLLPAVAAMLHAEHPKLSRSVWQTNARVTAERIDRTRDVQRLAATAILAIAAGDDPLCAEARAVLAQPEAK